MFRPIYVKKIMHESFQSAHFSDAKAAFKIKIGICKNDLPSESRFLALDRVLAKPWQTRLHSHLLSEIVVVRLKKQINKQIGKKTLPCDTRQGLFFSELCTFYFTTFPKTWFLIFLSNV